MSTAKRLTEKALYAKYTVNTGDTATKGEGVLLDTDTAIDDCDAASDLAIGIATEAGVAADEVDICLFGHAVVPVLVGTGDCTRGTKAVLVSDGFTDAQTHNSDAGGGNESIYGMFMQSGTAGQFVGLLLSGASNRGY